MFLGRYGVARAQTTSVGFTAAQRKILLAMMGALATLPEPRVNLSHAAAATVTAERQFADLTPESRRFVADALDAIESAPANRSFSSMSAADRLQHLRLSLRPGPGASRAQGRLVDQTIVGIQTALRPFYPDTADAHSPDVAI
jgi:hypothetical protein